MPCSVSLAISCFGSFYLHVSGSRMPPSRYSDPPPPTRARPTCHEAFQRAADLDWAMRYGRALRKLFVMCATLRNEETRVEEYNGQKSTGVRATIFMLSQQSYRIKQPLRCIDRSQSPSTNTKHAQEDCKAVIHGVSVSHASAKYKEGKQKCLTGLARTAPCQALVGRTEQ